MIWIVISYIELLPGIIITDRIQVLSTDKWNPITSM